MTLAFRVLGGPERDNALFVRVQTGQQIHRLLFDCGAGCPEELTIAEVQVIDHLLFSHLHMDHIAGFDIFFRRVFNRLDRPNCLWGPPGAARILHHRLQGFLWNLAHELQATWHLHDIHPDRISYHTALASEAFATLRPAGERPLAGPLFGHTDYAVFPVQLDHGTPSIGYIVREAPRANVVLEHLAAIGLRPGAWLQQVKQPRRDEPPTVEIDGVCHALADLRAALLVETPGDSLAYLTDFALDAEAELARVGTAITGCRTLICESQYRAADADLARRNRHMTAPQAAALAAHAGVERLVLFHISDRYDRDGRAELLAEARTIFPATDLPESW